MLHQDVHSFMQPSAGSNAFRVEMLSRPSRRFPRSSRYLRFLSSFLHLLQIFSWICDMSFDRSGRTGRGRSEIGIRTLRRSSLPISRSRMHLHLAGSQVSHAKSLGSPAKRRIKIGAAFHENLEEAFGRALQVGLARRWNNESARFDASAPQNLSRFPKVVDAPARTSADADLGRFSRLMFPRGVLCRQAKRVRTPAAPDPRCRNDTFFQTGHPDRS